MNTKPIKFKQWLPIDGRYTTVTIERPAAVADRALVCANALRGRFICQKLLGSGRVVVSFIVDNKALGSQVCADDDGVMLAVDRLVDDVHAMIKEEAA